MRNKEVIRVALYKVVVEQKSTKKVLVVVEAISDEEAMD